MKVVGNRVELDGDELATAVDAYLAAHRIAVAGPRTIRIFDGNGWTLCRDTGARVLIDPSGRLVDNREAAVAGDGSCGAENPRWPGVRCTLERHDGVDHYSDGPGKSVAWSDERE